jgi:hypothetical protein
MADREYFYFGTIKRYTAVFSSIFKGIRVQKVQNNTNISVEVPVRFAQKQKTRDANKTYPDMDNLSGFTGASAMISYEIVDMQYAADRATSQFNQFAKNNKVSYNRSPYDLTFNVSITAGRLDDALQVIEQIVPYFTPSINITLDEGEFGINNIPIVLNSIGSSIEYEGLVSDTRTIIFTLVFTLKGWLYRNNRIANMISKTILNIGDFDDESLFYSYESEVVPNDAVITDEYEIIRTETNNV